MSDPNAPITLGLNSPQPPQQIPQAEDLQFERAVPVAGASSEAQQRVCLICKTALVGEYFHAQGQPVCTMCKTRIEAGQQSPPSISIFRAGLYGAGAALAGATLFAVVAIIVGYTMALISILIGFMVGKAVRKGSMGLGGRPQQILAVALTYFAITSGYIPVVIYHTVKQSQHTVAATTANPNAQVQTTAGAPITTSSPKLSLIAALMMLLLLALAAPFLSLSAGVGGILNLLIIFFGLQQAWRLTRRTEEVVITGPYTAETA
jgi:hypothetical protein